MPGEEGNQHHRKICRGKLARVCRTAVAIRLARHTNSGAFARFKIGVEVNHRIGSRH